MYVYIYYPCLSRKYFLEAGIIYIHVYKQFNKIRNAMWEVQLCQKNLA